MSLKRPGRSVTRMSPLGRNTMLHGLSRPSAIGTTRIFRLSVLNSRLWPWFCRGLAANVSRNAPGRKSKQVSRLIGECMDSRGTKAVMCSQELARNPQSFLQLASVPPKMNFRIVRDSDSDARNPEHQAE